MSPTQRTGDLTWYDEAVQAALAPTISSMAELIASSSCIRDIDDRANYECEASLPDGTRLTLHLKLRKPQRGLFRSKAPGTALEAEGIHAARRVGVRVPTLVCSGVDKKLGALTMTRAVEAGVPLDQLVRERRLNRSQRRATLFHLARAAAALHNAGLHHRDLYLNHIYVDPHQDHPEPTIIDWERYGEHKGAMGRYVVKDLAALLASALDAGVRRTNRLRFLSSYMTYRHLSIDAYGALLLQKVEAKAERIRAHVPKTPVGDAARPTSKDGSSP